MADATIGVIPPGSPTTLLDATSLTVSAQTVLRERMNIAGAGATDLASVKGASTAAVATDGALVVAISPNSATITDGTNAAAVKAASTAAVAADKALVVAVSPNTTVNVTPISSTTSNSPAQQTVGTTSGSILASNAARKKFRVTNTGSTIIYLGFGQTPTTTAHHVPLAPCANGGNDGTGGWCSDDTWDGSVNAISSAAGGTVCVMELT